MNKGAEKTLSTFMAKIAKGDTSDIIQGLEHSVEYLKLEVAILQEAIQKVTGSHVIHLSHEQKRCLSQKAQALKGDTLNEIETVFSPATVLRWYTTLIAEKYNSVGEGQKKRGRKHIPKEACELALRIAQENPTWGYQRIADTINLQGFNVSVTSVRHVLNDHSLFPNGQAFKNWMRFLEAHKDVIAACDFATYELLTPYSRQREHILFFEDIATREVWCGGIRHCPDGKWMAQVARNQVDCFDGRLNDKSFLIHDGDRLFTKDFNAILKGNGCRSLRPFVHCPQANGYIESFIKTFKAECLDYLILTSEAQLRYVVREFLMYYNTERPHSGLDGHLIKPTDSVSNGEIKCFTRLGGLLKSYRRVAA